MLPFSDQSRYQVTPAMEARRTRSADTKAWLIPKTESFAGGGGTIAMRTSADSDFPPAWAVARIR